MDAAARVYHEAARSYLEALMERNATMWDAAAEADLARRHLYHLCRRYGVKTPLERRQERGPADGTERTVCRA